MSYKSDTISNRLTLLLLQVQLSAHL